MSWGKGRSAKFRAWNYLRTERIFTRQIVSDSYNMQKKREMAYPYSYVVEYIPVNASRLRHSSVFMAHGDWRDATEPVRRWD